ncbi:MAG: hypothetical protein AAFO75_10805, partial [Pseudomonadota bacterium]
SDSASNIESSVLGADDDVSTRHGHRRGRDHHKRTRSAYRLAKRLSALETYVGIRSNQLDVWRDFTDAMIAVAPRGRHHKRGHHGKSKKRHARRTTTGRAAAPMDRVTRMARRAIKRGRSGEKLLSAIADLKAQLTPEQLQRFGEAERMLMRRSGHHKHHGHHGRKGHRGGYHGGGGYGKHHGGHGYGKHKGMHHQRQGYHYGYHRRYGDEDRGSSYERRGHAYSGQSGHHGRRHYRQYGTLGEAGVEPRRGPVKRGQKVRRRDDDRNRQQRRSSVEDLGNGPASASPAEDSEDQEPSLEAEPETSPEDTTNL